jgi:hypothetical protein
MFFWALLEPGNLGDSRGKTTLLMAIFCAALAIRSGPSFAVDTSPQEAREISLANAVIVLHPGEVSSGERAAAQMLSEEVEKRAGIKLPVGTEWPKTPGPAIVITTRSSDVSATRQIPGRTGKDLPETKPEGFYLAAKKDSQPTVLIIGADPRGALFGVGCLLRNLQMEKGSVRVPAGLEVATSPAYPIRGHQLGYRPRANSWDAWTLEQFDEYIRELAIFGTNCIENIPFQDDDPGPLMKLPRDEMNIKMAQICDKYDLDYWIWAPAEIALDDKEKKEALLARHEAFFKDCPRLDGVFFPGGDPGDNPPELVLPYLEEVSKLLAKYHPKAGLWMSLQGFDKEQTLYVLDYLQKNQPDWLRGLVAGPSSPPIPELRKGMPAKYQLRDYPDITHIVRAQYPVPWLDTAFCMTLGRESVNPRPLYYARVIRHLAPYTNGFLSYSDGVHDDVNKVIWSMLEWDPAMDTRQILIEYSRFFFGDKVAERAADGILALENNYVGSLAENGSVDATLACWHALEQEAPENGQNWRWLMNLYRAYYDAYTRHRLIHETALENEACEALAAAPESGSEPAMDKALQILARADSECPHPEYRQRVFDLADDLFRTISLQTSVPKYQASGAERGASLDFLDIPLNNRWWIEDEFTKIRGLDTKEKKLARLDTIRTWTHPGPGSFYDDVGNVGNSEHVVMGEAVNTDPLLDRSAAPTFMWWDNGKSRRRISWPSIMDWPIAMRYEGLDPKGDYVVRLTGQGEAKLRIDGELVEPTLYSKEIGEFKEFPVPKASLEDGLILLTWDRLDEAHLNWRQQSNVAEVWLLKR